MNDPHDIAADAWIEGALGELLDSRPVPPCTTDADPRAGRRLVAVALLALGFAVPLAIWMRPGGDGPSARAVAVQDPDRTGGQDPATEEATPCRLLLIGEANWDYRYTRNALLRHKAVQVSTCVAGTSTPAKDSRVEPAARPVALPTELADLEGYDGVLLLSLAPLPAGGAGLDDTEREIVRRAVTRDLIRLLSRHAQRGGTVLVTVQPRLLDLVGDDEVLARLVPAALRAFPSQGDPGFGVPPDEAPRLEGLVKFTALGENDDLEGREPARLHAWTERLRIPRLDRRGDTLPALRIEALGEGSAIALSPDVWRIRRGADGQKAFDHFWASFAEFCRPK